MKRETTPAKVTYKIMDLCSGTVPEVAPVYIPVEAAGRSLMNECFPNIQRMGREQGGQQVNGWAVWQWGNIAVTLEAHAVWESPEGKLNSLPKEMYLRIMQIQEILHTEACDIANGIYSRH